MGVDQVSKHAHTSDTDGGEKVYPDRAFVLAEQSSDVTIGTAGTYETVPYDTVVKDARGEFSGGQFVPAETGFYCIVARAEFGVGADQDELKLQLYDVDAGASVTENEERASGPGNRNRSLVSELELTAGTTYEIQATNSDSTDTVNGKPKRTRLTIRQDLVQ